MSKTDGLGGFLDSVYRSVAAAAEVAKVLADVVDDTAMSVIDGIEHLQEVYPDVFGDEFTDSPVSAAAPVEDESYSETIDVFEEETEPENTEPTREEKIAYILRYLRRRNISTQGWANPEQIPDKSVDVSYDCVLALEDREKENQKAAVRRLNTYTDNDRFNRITEGNTIRYGEDENTF